MLDAATLADRGARAANGLSGLGAGPGGVVALLLRNDLAFFEATLAARLAGAYLVPINWHFAADEVAYILHDSGANVVVVHADLLPGVIEVIPAQTRILVVPTSAEIALANGVLASACAVPDGQVDWNDWIEAAEPLECPADPPGSLMLYTSGTTGRPKGVRREPTQPHLVEVYRDVIADAFGIRPGMKAVMTGPLYHSAPFGFANVGVQLGCQLDLMPRFDAERLLARIESERYTHMHMVPTMFVRLLRLPESVRERYDLSSLEGVVHGAAPCPIEVKRRMIEWWGPVLIEYYGSTEASLSHGVGSAQWLERPGTVGQPLPGARAEIRGDAGERLAAGQVGEIYVRIRGAPEFTYHRREAERQEIESDGLLTNGDLGYVDADGFLFLCDRKRDMIISGGVNIYPAEIEAALILHPDVRDCAVFGIPEPEFGEQVAAAVELETPVEAQALLTFLAQRIARYKLPRHIEFHDHLPRLDNGKIYKQSLRAPFWAHADRRI